MWPVCASVWRPLKDCSRASPVAPARRRSPFAPARRRSPVESLIPSAPMDNLVPAGCRNRRNGVCFRKTRFDGGTLYADVPPEFGDVSTPFLVNLARGGSVAFEQCRFGRVRAVPLRSRSSSAASVAFEQCRFGRVRAVPLRSRSSSAASVAFEQCRFGNGLVQIRAFGESMQGTAGARGGMVAKMIKSTGRSRLRRVPRVEGKQCSSRVGSRQSTRCGG